MPKYKDMIIKLFKHYGVRNFECKFFFENEKGKVKMVVPEVTDLSNLQMISHLLGTNEIKIKSIRDRFKENVLEVQAANVNLDNIKIQAIYLESY